jgi:hypothetical protein
MNLNRYNTSLASLVLDSALYEGDNIILPVKIHYLGKKPMWVEQVEEHQEVHPLVRETRLRKLKVPFFCKMSQLVFTKDPWDDSQGVSTICEKFQWCYWEDPFPEYKVESNWASKRLQKMTLRNLKSCMQLRNKETFLMLFKAAVKAGYRPNEKSQKAYQRFLDRTEVEETEEKETKQEAEKRRKDLKKLKNSKAKNSKRKGKKPWREH